MLTKETAQALVRLIQAEADNNVETAGGQLTAEVRESPNMIELVIKVYYLDKGQTTLDEFVEE
jgi:hypothetical protein